MVTEERNIKYLGLVIVLLTIILAFLVACNQRSPVTMPPEAKPPEKITSDKNQEEIDSSPVRGESDNDWEIIDIFYGEESQSALTFSVPGDRWRISCTAEAEYYEHAVFNIFIYSGTSTLELVSNISCLPDIDTGVVYYYDGKGDYSIKVIAANLQAWTIVVKGYADERPLSTVQITRVHYFGTVYPPEDCQCYERNEPDEYVVVRNLGDGWEDVRGWLLKNITKGYPSFTFPAYFPCVPEYFERYHEEDFSGVPPIPCILGPKQSAVIYTDEIHPETGCLSFNFGTGNIWDNEIPDIAVLYNNEGMEVSRKSYVTGNKE